MCMIYSTLAIILTLISFIFLLSLHIAFFQARHSKYHEYFRYGMTHASIHSSCRTRKKHEEHEKEAREPIKEEEEEEDNAGRGGGRDESWRLRR